MSHLIDPDHAEWITAFNRWYHNGSRESIINNLRKGVPLSPQNSKFLAAILDGKAKPLSGKQTGLARFKSNIIDNKISQLITRGMKRDDILADLKRTGLYEEHKAIDGLNKRIDREKVGYVNGHSELEKKFGELYEATTKN
jgi:hypothetical protein